MRDASKLSSGDVLVTRQTDPGWASVLYLVSGLVTERGVTPATFEGLARLYPEFAKTKAPRSA